MMITCADQPMPLRQLELQEKTAHNKDVAEKNMEPCEQVWVLGGGRHIYIPVGRTKVPSMNRVTNYNHSA